MALVFGQSAVFRKAGLLFQRGDPLSIDCADGCWGCIGETEAAMGDPASLSALTSNLLFK